MQRAIKALISNDSQFANNWKPAAVNLAPSFLNVFRSACVLEGKALCERASTTSHIKFFWSHIWIIWVLTDPIQHACKILNHFLLSRKIIFLCIVSPTTCPPDANIIQHHKHTVSWFVWGWQIIFFDFIWQHLCSQFHHVAMLRTHSFPGDFGETIFFFYQTFFLISFTWSHVQLLRNLIQLIPGWSYFHALDFFSALLRIEVLFEWWRWAGSAMGQTTQPQPENSFIMDIALLTLVLHEVSFLHFLMTNRWRLTSIVAGWSSRVIWRRVLIMPLMLTESTFATHLAEFCMPMVIPRKS